MRLRSEQCSSVCRLALLVAVMCVTSLPARAENIDPGNDDSQYAWAENVGWLNVEPNGDGGPGVQVGDSELSGWIWAENIGWISLSCENTLSCATEDYRITNDGNGVLSGYAWAENIGWISFACENTGTCGSADYGVEIDPGTGEFDGYAWSENVGWVSFNCTNDTSCGTVDYKVKTGWVCVPPPAAPSEAPELTIERSGTDALLLWDLIPGATGSDIVRGTLSTLTSSDGDFILATEECLYNNRTATSLLYAGSPPQGDGFWFLVRGQNCGGNGTYDSGGVGQVGTRDAEIAASGNDCP